MSSKVNTANDDILNEIIGIEYEDDDALTLLDDEEAVTTVKEEDEDLASFYAETKEPVQPVKRNVDLYTEQTVTKPEVEIKNESVPSKVENKTPTLHTTVTPNKDVNASKENIYQNKLDQLATNIDAYLNGSLESRKDDVKVEKMNSVVVEAPKVIPKPVSAQPETIKTPGFNQMSAPEVKETVKSTNNLEQLFAKVSDNVRGASDVKRKMEERYRELQRLYDEFEKKKKADYAEINAYKDEVYNKLKVRKEEIDEQARKLKVEQDILANQKKQFETEKAVVCDRLFGIDQADEKHDACAQDKESERKRNVPVIAEQAGAVQTKEQGEEQIKQKDRADEPPAADDGVVRRRHEAVQQQRVDEDVFRIQVGSECVFSRSED